MKFIRWFIGAVVLVGIVALIIKQPLPTLFPGSIVFGSFVTRGLLILILASFLALYRICRGPTGADRIVAIDIMGIMIIGLCSLLSVATGRSWYIDIAIAWALQSFISTLALSKYLEGRDFDE